MDVHKMESGVQTTLNKQKHNAYRYNKLLTFNKIIQSQFLKRTWILFNVRIFFFSFFYRKVFNLLPI